MIPYFTIPSLKLGPLPIHPFGVLVALGCLIGANIVERHAKKTGLNLDVTRGLITWVLVGGFAGAHIFDVVAYTPRELLDNPLLLLQFWNGISSFGGFMGALIAFWIFLKRKKQPYRPFADALAMGLAPGWVFGRAGCTIAHDHQGRLTDFFLAVDYPAGARHNLGFYEFVYSIIIVFVLFRLAKKPRPSGFLVGWMAVLYAPVRFLLDFLRAVDLEKSDPRYAGLTPGQWLAMATLAGGVLVLRRALAQNELPPFRARLAT